MSSFAKAHIEILYIIPPLPIVPHAHVKYTSAHPFVPEFVKATHLNNGNNNNTSPRTIAVTMSAYDDGRLDWLSGEATVEAGDAVVIVIVAGRHRRGRSPRRKRRKGMFVRVDEGEETSH